MFSVLNKRFEDWTPEIQKRLRELTNESDGGTSAMIHEVDCEESNPDTFVAFIDENPIGWSLFVPWHASEYESAVMVYVDHEYRLQGVGTILIELATEKHKQCMGFVWSKLSSLFYEKLSSKISGLATYDTRGIEIAQCNVGRR